jgi:hypothetical protein
VTFNGMDASPSWASRGITGDFPPDLYCVGHGGNYSRHAVTAGTQGSMYKTTDGGEIIPVILRLKTETRISAYLCVDSSLCPDLPYERHKSSSPPLFFFVLLLILLGPSYFLLPSSSFCCYPSILILHHSTPLPFLESNAVTSVKRIL